MHFVEDIVISQSTSLAIIYLLYFLKCPYYLQRRILSTLQTWQNWASELAVVDIMNDKLHFIKNFLGIKHI